MKDEEIRKEVRNGYAKAAKRGSSCCAPPELRLTRSVSSSTLGVQPFDITVAAILHAKLSRYVGS